MNHHFILGVHITDRLKDAVAVQQLLTKYGSHIKTRLGLHEIQPDSPSPQGLVILEVVGETSTCESLAAALGAIEGVDVQQMVFTH
ncbi:MAG TPA: hypothetical protein VGK32_11685 [Vicinamibacterales bacterium]|jgi:hypothetical protein